MKNKPHKLVNGKVVELSEAEIADLNQAPSLSLEEKKQLLKNELIASRRLYLNQTFQAAFEALEDSLEFPDKGKRKIAKAEIREIEAATTLETFSKFEKEFK